MPEKVLITSALPYANGPLHFGHIAGAYLPGDAYARFQRLMEKDVLYLCGSDEYGLPITISAEMAGRSPQEHVDIYHATIKAFFEKLSFSFNHYSRTTWPGHKETVQQFFLDLLEQGHIEERITDQLYSEKDKRFLADRYVVGTCPKCGFEAARGDECPKCGASYETTDLLHPRSKISGAPLLLKATKHWFLRFDHFKQELSKWIAEKKWKPNVLNFAKAYVEQLHQRAITRDSDWGVPLPLKATEGKVFYVWFDAPIGYISAAREWAEKLGDPDQWKTFWCDPKTKLVQFVGKDNIPFHAVFFPAMIMGQKTYYKLVDELPANEFLNLEGRQFSKSDGWTIDLERFFSHFTADQIRYYLAANAPETHDAEFTWRDFQLRCNSELLGKFANLANRTLVFAQKHCLRKIPPLENLTSEDKNFLEKIKILAESTAEAYEHFSTRKAAQHIMELASLSNVYFDAKKPWVLAKETQTYEAMQTTIACCLESLKTLALIASPIIPNLAQKLWELLGYTSKIEQEHWRSVMEKPLVENIQLPTPEPLVKKVEDEVIEKEIALLKETLEKKTSSESKYPPLKDLIDFETFSKLDMRIGKITQVEIVPKSKKLLKLTVDLGFEARTIISGISPYFENPQELVNKKVLILANLKPAKLMGIESQGMLLVANAGEKIEIPYFQMANPGDIIS